MQVHACMNSVRNVNNGIQLKCTSSINNQFCTLTTILFLCSCIHSLAKWWRFLQLTSMKIPAWHFSWHTYIIHKYYFSHLHDNKTQTCLQVSPSHHNCFTALFRGPPGWAGAKRELLDFMVQGKINRGIHTDHSIRTNQCPPPPVISVKFCFKNTQNPSVSHNVELDSHGT